jgi:threonine/homoserine/homoserine lactone efflux protein
MFTEVLTCFLVAAALSFAGSLQPGPVNMAVIGTAYRNGFRPSLWFALGGALPELIYSAAAIACAGSLQPDSRISLLLRGIAIPVLFAGGIMLWMKKENQQAAPKQHKSKLLLSGFMLGAMNPMLFAFWFITCHYLQSNGIVSISGTFNSAAFIAGTAAGAFLLLLLLAWLVQQQHSRLTQVFGKRMNRLIGAAFIIFALTETVRFFS